MDRTAIDNAALLLAVLDDDRSPLRSWLPATARNKLRAGARQRRRRVGAAWWEYPTLAGDLAVVTVAAHLLCAGEFDAVLSAVQRRRLHLVLWARLAGEPMSAPAKVSGRDAEIACPYCPTLKTGRPRRHLHGLPGGRGELPTIRTAHCPSSRWHPDSYLIVSE